MKNNLYKNLFSLFIIRLDIGYDRNRFGLKLLLLREHVIYIQLQFKTMRNELNLLI
jgi:hypothetical protein